MMDDEPNVSELWWEAKALQPRRGSAWKYYGLPDAPLPWASREARFPPKADWQLRVGSGHCENDRIKAVSRAMKYVLRVIATALYFVLVGCIAIGSTLGDCFPDLGHVCPTDADRTHRMLVICVVGLIAYFPLGWLALRADRRR